MAGLSRFWDGPTSIAALTIAPCMQEAIPDGVMYILWEGDQARYGKTRLQIPSGTRSTLAWPSLMVYSVEVYATGLCR